MNYGSITNYLDSLIDRGIPSVDCMIFENHKLLYRHFAGKIDEAKKVNVSEDVQYLMFSMTKLQTMAAAMQLIEQGRLSLDDEVGLYLPAYKNLKVESENGVVNLDKPLLIWHLLSMQSGLDYDLTRPGIVKLQNEMAQNRATEDISNKQVTRKFADAFVESPLKFVPGKHFQYSLSHDVVAAIIEVVSGMSFGEYLKKNIWEPLGMTRTYFAKPLNDDIDNLATQYICDEQGNISPMEPSCNYQLAEGYESGGAGLVSCTEDYAVFADTIACGGISKDGVRILKPETIEIMKTNRLGEDALVDIVTGLGRKGYGYGCGVQVLMKPEILDSPAPVGVFGWDGAAGSCTIMDTVSKRSLVYTMHVRGCGMAYGEIHPRLRDFMFEE